jgi:hypothetical protein
LVSIPFDQNKRRTTRRRITMTRTMDYQTPGPRPSRKAAWAGWIIGALPVLLMIATAIPTIAKPAGATEGMNKFGYPPHLIRPLAIVELVCAVLYMIPRTAFLGAILLTGYFGGATATHVRIHDPLLFVPIVVGILVWLGLFLRDRRVRALIPLRS